MTRRDAPMVAVSDEDFFFKVAKLAFLHRRKTLWNNLQSAFGKTAEVREQLTQALEAADISPQIRGRHFQFQNLLNYLKHCYH
jgi:16S rRNA (adenine1518-N6/adenine1519-N6)-dimethyltransferase